MRVCIVAFSVLPNFERHAAVIANHLAERCAVLIIGCKGMRRQLFHPAVEVQDLCSTSRPTLQLQTFNATALSRVIRAARRFDPDVVHFICAHPWNLALALALPKPVKIFTIHDVVPHPGEPVAPFVTMYNRLVVRHLADFLVLHGRMWLEYVQEQYGFPRDRMHVVPLGEFEAPPAPPPPPRKPTVLFFGRIRPYKGLRVLAAAWAGVRLRIPGARLVVAGYGALDAATAASLRGDDTVSLRNERIGDDEIGQLFAEASVVVLPYTSATQSGVIPLAYAHRRPVVASATGALVEMVRPGETGLLVPPGDPAALCDALSELLADPVKCAAMGEAGYRWFCEAFAPSVMARELEGWYRRAVSRRQHLWK